jgi:hypothetical protein
MLMDKFTLDYFTVVLKYYRCSDLHCFICLSHFVPISLPFSKIKKLRYTSTKKINQKLT